jgi:hypothetical protein
MSEDDSSEPTAAEQGAFSRVHDVVDEMVGREGHPAVEVGRGILTAAVVCLRKALPDEEVAKLLYGLADGWATSRFERER